jgi:hypothetical protein
LEKRDSPQVYFVYHDSETRTHNWFAFTAAESFDELKLFTFFDAQSLKNDNTCACKFMWMVALHLHHRLDSERRRR